MSRESVRRAVVTGMGVISPIGNNRESFVDSVLSARSGIDPIKTFDTSPFRTPYGGEVKGFDPLRAGLTEDEISLLNDRYLQLGLIAARQALADAGLSWSREDRPGSRPRSRPSVAARLVPRARRAGPDLLRSEGPGGGRSGLHPPLRMESCAGGSETVPAWGPGGCQGS